MANPFRSLLGGAGADEDDGEGESFSDGAFSLSPLQKMYAFVAFMVAGLACMLLSLLVFYSPIKFAVLFTFGNILAVGSTAFLIGAEQQARMMLDPVRIYATFLYIGSVVLSLICALLFHSKILTLLAMITECCALIWYGLSYVPFARRMVSELLISCCDTEV